MREKIGVYVFEMISIQLYARHKGLWAIKASCGHYRPFVGTIGQF